MYSSLLLLVLVFVLTVVVAIGFVFMCSPHSMVMQRSVMELGCYAHSGLFSIIVAKVIVSVLLDGIQHSSSSSME